MQRQLQGAAAWGGASWGRLLRSTSPLEGKSYLLCICSDLSESRKVSQLRANSRKVYVQLKQLFINEVSLVERDDPSLRRRMLYPLGYRGRRRSLANPTTGARARQLPNDISKTRDLVVRHDLSI